MTSPLARLQNPGLLKTAALIGGAWISADEGFDVRDPATGAVLARVPDLGPADVQAAIDAASAAGPAWRGLTAKERSIRLRRWFDLLLANREDLALLITTEQGKPFAESLAEVDSAASFVEWYAEEAKRANGETLSTFDANRRLLVLRQPIGVCAAITPWNFPLSMVTRKLAPALAAGCTVVLKPAEATPLSALAAAALALDADIPPGVLNVVTASRAGSAAIGAVLCASATVRHLSFTGSTAVGRLLMAQCAPTIKKLALELGGNAPFIVFDDADLESAVEGAMASKFRNAGQTCVCVNRFYVQEGIYGSFVARLSERVAAMKVGNGLDPGVDQGPMIDAASVAKVAAHVADAVAQGGRVVAGGRALAGGGFQPTVIANANASMRCAHEETFGPLAPVFRFQTEDEVVAAANATESGLASYLYTRDIGRITRVSEALEYGMVGVNVGLMGSENAPFGGIKQSGLGREGSHHGLDEYLELKYVCLGDIATSGR